MAETRDRRRRLRRKTVEQGSEFTDFAPSTELDVNVEAIKKLFAQDETLVTRYVENKTDSGLRGCLVYTDGMVSNQIMNDHIIRPFQNAVIDRAAPGLLKRLMDRDLQSNEVKLTVDFEEIIQAVVYGDTVLFVQGDASALILNTKSFTLRSPSEPESEKVLEGPREGFSEGILTNLSFLRRRVRTEDLKMRFMTFGTRTKTRACMCYIDGIVNPEILQELERRLQGISQDGVLDTNYINELVRDSPHSLFRTTGRTERPDVVAARLLEGRIAIFLDGTPIVMTVPYLFIENFQSSEDYYLGTYYASFTRLLRMLAFIMTVTVPALYLALVTYHQELLPIPLLMSLTASRMGVPFPTVVECFLMLFVFQILSETGIRMPVGIGQALSIVGALVIGQAAVEAKLVSAPMIIIVGFTGITGLLVPRLSSATIYLRFSLLMLSSFLGLYGLMFGIIGIFIHLYGLQSFSVPYVTDIVTTDFQKIKDVLVRASWKKMNTRPNYLTRNHIRSDRGRSEDA